MKLFFSILILSLHLTPAQVSEIAIITNPQIGSEENAQNLLEAVGDINARQGISCVVVIGNITANGKFDEFIWAQEILDELTVPYFVVGGEKDYLLSENLGSEIEWLWGDDKNFFAAGNFNLLCLNTFLPGYSNKKHLSIETLSWINAKLSSEQLNNILIISYNPLGSTDNNRKFYEAVLNYKIFSIVGTADKSKTDPGVMEGLYLNRKDGWGYLLVSVRQDSLFIKNIFSGEIKKKGKSQITKSEFAAAYLQEPLEPEKYLLPGRQVWTVETRNTINFPPFIEHGNIFIITKKGLAFNLNKSGQAVWSYEINQRIQAPPIADKDLLITATAEGDILLLDVNNGLPFQVIGTAEEITSGIALIEADKNKYQTSGIVAGTEYGNLYCYDLLSLEPIWTKQLPSGIVIPPIVYSDNKILYRDNEGILYCRSSASGSLIWQFAAGFLDLKKGESLYGNDIAVKDKDIYLTDDAGNLHCVDALLGTKKWELANIKANGIIRLYDHALVLPTINNKIIIVSKATGKIVKEFVFPADLKNEFITGLTIIRDKFITGFTNGWVYQTDSKGKTEKIFRGGQAPIISLQNIEGNCLVTDLDGKLTLLNISEDRK